MNSIKDLFLLDPDTIFLNHGSFGACPREVFQDYQKWQYKLEHQPVEFLARQAITLLADSRSELADFINAPSKDIVYFTNPTTALNMVAKNITSENAGLLYSGDEILTTDHEYGALDRTWRYWCRTKGIQYVRHPIPLPVDDPETFIDTFWSGVNENTRVIYLSHITSPTGLIFPVKDLCKRARQEGIISIIDGAHAPGQILLDLKDIAPDIYTGACHKWLMSPKGASFLYAAPSIQPYLEPLIVSWGYESEFPGISDFIDYHEWQGTKDIAAYLSVPTAIKFFRKNRWETVAQDCHILAIEAQERLCELFEVPPVSPGEAPDISDQMYQWFKQMFAVEVPSKHKPYELQKNLFDQFKIEVPVISWSNKYLLRISIQGYNSMEDVTSLCQALEKIIN